MTFNEFVKQLSENDFPTQFAHDFADDWKSDSLKPEVKNKEEAINYLVFNNACDEALKGLNDLWDFYKNRI
jgi:hypothetical protein